MSCIIIVMRKMEDAKKIGGLLSRQGHRSDLLCTSAAEALSESSRRDNGGVICGSSLGDMSFIEFRDCLPREFRLIILSRNIMNDEYPEDAVKLAMPFKAVELISLLEKELSSFRRSDPGPKGMLRKRSIEDRKYIDRAKAVLMEKKGMTEPEAYRYLQKSSMDSSNSLVETAQMVLLISK